MLDREKRIGLSDVPDDAASRTAAIVKRETMMNFRRMAHEQATADLSRLEKRKNPAPSSSTE